MSTNSLILSIFLAKKALDAGKKAAKRGDWKKSRREFNTVLRYRPKNRQAKKALKKIRYELSRSRKVESTDIYREGLEAFLKGDYEAATRLWREALDVYPENMEAKRGLNRLKLNQENGKD